MIGTHGEIRTHNIQVLNLTSLPVGLHGLKFGGMQRDQTALYTVKSVLSPIGCCYLICWMPGVVPPHQSLSSKPRILLLNYQAIRFGTPRVNRTLPTGLEDQCLKAISRGSKLVTLGGF